MSPVMGDPFARAINARPSSRIPVPASRTTRAPLGVRTSIDGVFPPYRTVADPGVGIEPRVPQKRSRKDIRSRNSGLGTSDWGLGPEAIQRQRALLSSNILSAESECPDVPSRCSSDPGLGATLERRSVRQGDA